MLEDFFSQIKRDRYTPFHIGAIESQSGFRLGGAAPHEISPSYRNQFTKYFLTMPLVADFEISIFYSFDFYSDGNTNPYDMAYTLIGSENKLIELCFHESSVRGGRSGILSDFPALSLVTEGFDYLENSNNGSECYSFHKIGGEPYFTHEFSNIKRQCDQLLKEGFYHILQFAFPVGPKDVLIDANWPFGEAIFHVFAKYDGGFFSYKYCWG